MPELTPEQLARQQIDAQLVASGWVVQDYKQFNPSAGRGIALREAPLKSGTCDYLLLLDRKAVGVTEAKKKGTLLSGVAEQSGHYAENLPEFIQSVTPGSLPFLYESTGVETFFRDERDPEPRSRRVFSFHRPETLAAWLTQPDTLRQRLAAKPFAYPLPARNLRGCQFEGITNLEESFAAAHLRALIQMATGAGKTYTACSFTYRIIKHAGAKRVLFLVDRANLGRQAMAEFQQFVAPDTGRKFTEVYNVQHLTSSTLDSVARVTICTIQRLYSILRGEELDPDLDELSGYEVAAADGCPKDVAYNAAIPIEAFDFIVTDECHRSIYGLWRQVLEYFDAFLIGLTATPSKQTIGFFNQNLVMEYSHERAVADGVNVGYEVYRIKTQVTEQGGKVEKGFYVDRRSKETRAVRWECLDEDLTYANTDLDRSVVVKSQIRTVLQTFKDALSTELFPGRALVPKTLIFCKDDSHAEDTVHLVREVFGKGNDFAKKITYKTYNTETKRYEKSETLIQEFRTSPQLRIAVTVDMIATGTDIKPLECLLFLRDTRSRTYFEQMKGRGTRVLTPSRGFDAAAKERATGLLSSFRDYIEQHQSEIIALQILYSRPFKQRLTEPMLKDLEKKLRDNHAAWTEDNLWNAFAATAPAKVKGRSQAGRFADLVAIVRFTLELQPVLTPFADSVSERFNGWLIDKAKDGIQFSSEQLAWLDLIRDHIATAISIEPEDLELSPFNQRGGLGKAHQLFGEQLPKLLDELNLKLVA